MTNTRNRVSPNHFFYIVAVLAMAPVAGYQPKREEKILAAPCAINSIFGTVFYLLSLNPENITAERSDSILSNMAIANAG